MKNIGFSPPIHPKKLLSSVMTCYQGPLARQIIFFTFLLSSFLTLLITLVQLYFDYQHDTSQVNRAFEQIETSFLQSLTESAWTFDEKLMKGQINGITKIPYIIYAEFQFNNTIFITSGKIKTKNIREEIYPLYFTEKGKVHRIGILKVLADYELIYKNLRQKIVLILITQGFKTFIVASSLFFLFYFFVTRHLISLAKQTNFAILDTQHDPFQRRPKQKISREKKKLRKKSENEIERLEEALNSMVKNIKTAHNHLIQTNEDLEYFVHVAAHDLKEPVRRLSVLADLLQGQAEAQKNSVAEKQNNNNSLSLIQNVKVAALQMAQMIEDFRIFSQLGYGLVYRTKVPLKDLIQGILQELNENSRDLPVHFNFSLSTINAYESLIRVLYRNLILNALKYAVASQLSLSFDAHQEKGRYILGVYNTGSCLSPDLQEQIFKPFRRYSTSSGLGIGLTICQRVVERHGGKIWVESGLNWVHFKFTLKDSPNSSA